MILPLKQAKILIVEDEKINIDLLIALLQGQYEIVIAKNGEQAFKRLEDDSKPDLILLDIVMPGINGYQVGTQLKSREDTKNIPFIFFTARGATTDIVKGFQVGAVDYITKPFQSEELLARVNLHIHLQKTINALDKANKEIIQLKSLLPICCVCKKIRDDEGYWNEIDSYISKHSHIQFSHSFCPACARKFYPDIYKNIKE